MCVLRYHHGWPIYFDVRFFFFLSIRNKAVKTGFCFKSKNDKKKYNKTPQSVYGMEKLIKVMIDIIAASCFLTT